MIDIRDHGGNFSGNGNSYEKILNVIVSLTEPPKPKKFDVWVKTDTYKEIIVHEDRPSDLVEGNILIPKYMDELVNKQNIEKGKLSIELPGAPGEEPASKIMYYDAKYHSIFTRLSQPLKVVNGQYKLIESYWYDGVKWVKLGNSGNFLLASVMGSNEYSLLDTVNEKKIKSVNFGHERSFGQGLIILDKKEKVIMLDDKDKAIFGFFDYNLNLLKTINQPSGQVVYRNGKSPVVALNYAKETFFVYRTADIKELNFNGDIISVYNNSSYYENNGENYHDSKNDTLTIFGRSDNNSFNLRMYKTSPLSLVFEKESFDNPLGVRYKLGYIEDKDLIYYCTTFNHEVKITFIETKSGKVVEEVHFESPSGERLSSVGIIYNESGDLCYRMTAADAGNNVRFTLFDTSKSGSNIIISEYIVDSSMKHQAFKATRNIITDFNFDLYLFLEQEASYTSEKDKYHIVRKNKPGVVEEKKYSDHFGGNGKGTLSTIVKL